MALCLPWATARIRPYFHYTLQSNPQSNPQANLWLIRVYPNPPYNHAIEAMEQMT